MRAAEALAPRLALKEAAAAAQMCMAAIGSATTAYAVSGLAQAEAALAARLSPEEAARLASAAARKVLDAMSKADNAYYLPPLSGALAFLAPWLGLEDSSAAVRQVQETMGRTKDPYRLAALAGAEAALAPRLGPEEAARLSSAAARQAVEVMSKPGGSSAALTMSGEVLVYVAVPGHGTGGRGVPAGGGGNGQAHLLQRTGRPDAGRYCSCNERGAGRGSTASGISRPGRRRRYCIPEPLGGSTGIGACVAAVAGTFHGAATSP